MSPILHAFTRNNNDIDGFGYYTVNHVTKLSESNSKVDTVQI
jgi:hypothetical protein